MHLRVLSACNVEGSALKIAFSSVACEAMHVIDCDNKRHAWHHICLANGGASAFYVVCKVVVVYSAFVSYKARYTSMACRLSTLSVLEKYCNCIHFPGLDASQQQRLLLEGLLLTCVLLTQQKLLQLKKEIKEEVKEEIVQQTGKRHKTGFTETPIRLADGE